MPRAPGHPDVHQDDVGHELRRLLDGLGAVGGLADDLDVVLLLEDHLQPPAEQRVVVDDHHAQSLGTALRLVFSATCLPPTPSVRTPSDVSAPNGLGVSGF